MSTVTKLIDQQYGNCKWRNYDEAIKRLRCSDKGHYTQVLPATGSDDDLILDTPIFTCKFAQKQGNENLVALANEDGKLAVLDVLNDKERYGIRAHNNAIFDLSWMFGNMKIATASGDHTARLFDVTNCDIREIRMFLAHNRSVKTVSFKSEDPNIFATGGRDGHIVLWDARCDGLNNFVGKADRIINTAHNCLNNMKACNSPRRRATHHLNSIGAKSVTGLVFQNDNTLISCGAGDGFIKIWDLRRNYIVYKSEPLPKFKIPYSGNTAKNGFSNLILDNNGIILYANCLDNTIYSYNLNTYDAEPVMKYSGHQNNTFYIKSCLSSDGNYLISGSSDENAYIWNVKNTRPFLKLTGHNAEVTCVGWCQNEQIVVTCSDDMTHKIWKIENEELPQDWDTHGKGKAEILPLAPKKKHHLVIEEQISLKKFIKTCERCFKCNTTKESKCLNCSLLKRKISPVKPGRMEEELNALPNFVVTGTAPHLVFSPPKKKPHDWLTRMRIEKRTRRDLEDACPISPKSPRIESAPTSRCRSPQNSPILKFFKIATNTVCKTNALNSLVPSPQST